MSFEEVNAGGQSYQISLLPSTFGEHVKGFIHLPMAINAIILILSLVTIFLYKKRKQQMKLASLLLVLSALLIGNLFVFHFVKDQSSADVVNYKIASFFPIINCILAFAARHFIKKDEELVRSADRIR
jgi:amino acid permease